MFGEYIRLIRDYPRFLTFSSLHMFFSGPGQSFSFALFAPSFAAVFALGSVSVTMPALWAEVFGVDSLGAISSIVGSAGVFATALSPALFGWLLDHGLDLDRLVLGGVVLAVLVSLVAPAPTRHPRARAPM